VPRHTHTREDEAYFVLAGEMEVTVGDEAFILRPGDSLMAPRGIPHQLRNSGDAENGGGLSADGQRWIAGRPDYLLPVPVLSQLFRGLVLSLLLEAHTGGRLRFFGEHAALADEKAFEAFLAPLWRAGWVVYAKRPFSGPAAVLAYLARKPHSPPPEPASTAASNHRRACGCQGW
jgi:hypothetical protein